MSGSLPPVAVLPDGWSEWIHPLPGYRMQCCDCGLIHEMDFAIVEPNPGETTYNDGESDEGVIIFRARRWEGCTCDGVAPGSYANQVLVQSPWSGKIVSIDRCILPEVTRLWNLGVQTVESCCGHGIPGYIAVRPEDDVLMLAEGYQRETRTDAPHVFTWPRPGTTPPTVGGAGSSEARRQLTADAPAKPNGTNPIPNQEVTP